MPDAIIVPASRPAHAIERLIDLAARLGTELVVLCSRQASVEQVSERMERTIGSRGLVAAIGGCLTPAVTNTSGERFLVANGGRRSDLSAKRNIGLLLARLRGWSKIVFVDDDVEISAADVSWIARRLDRHSIVGMRCQDFPDNSVFGHARRLAALRQGVFVTGAVLGVDVRATDLGFFPDVYNEDWFFFGDAAAGRRLPRPRPARQAPYDPFATPRRARQEEFGDLLAEGLYALVESSGLVAFDQVVDLAGESFWEDFIEVRSEAIGTVHERLASYTASRACGVDVPTALEGLEAASAAYDRPQPAITPSTCVEFLDGWTADTAAWRRALPRSAAFDRSDDVMALIGATDLRTVRLPVRI